MRFNDKELIQISSGEGEIEGRLNHRRPHSGNFSQKGFKERWFKLKSNLLFYYHINEIGIIDDKQPAGVFILENSNIQYEVCNGVPFAFSMTFRDEPDRKHLFSGRSEDYIQQWVNAMKQATYGHWRSQLIILQTKINAKTGKVTYIRILANVPYTFYMSQDPLLMYPHNQGTVRDFQSFKSIGARSTSFHCHLQQTVETVKEGKKSFKSHIKTIEAKSDPVFCQNHIPKPPAREEKKVPVPPEKNLIEL